MKYQKRWMVCALGLLLMIIGQRLVSAQSNQTPELEIYPDTQEVNTGQVYQFQVEVIGAVEINAFDIHLAYDPDVIEIQDADDDLDGIQVGFGDFLVPDFVLKNEVDEEAGTIWVVMTQVYPSLPKTGDGVLLVIDFMAIRPNQETDVQVSKAVLATGTGREFETTGTPGTIEVVGDDIVLPTRTATSPPPTATRTSATNPTSTSNPAATSTQAPTRTRTATSAAFVQPSATRTRTPFPTAQPTSTGLPDSTSTEIAGDQAVPTETQVPESTATEQVVISQGQPEMEQEPGGDQEQTTSGFDLEEASQDNESQALDSDEDNGMPEWLLNLIEMVAVVVVVVLIVYAFRWLKSRNTT